MNIIIKLRLKKEIDRSDELKVLKLKDPLITKGYTEIIHIEDENEDFYANTFSTSKDLRKELEDFVLGYIYSHNLHDEVTLIDTDKQ